MNKTWNNILEVEDKEEIIRNIKSFLENKTITVFTDANGRKALEIFNRENISMILLDSMLPETIEEEVCQVTHNISRVPIIVLMPESNKQSILEGVGISKQTFHEGELTVDFEKRLIKKNGKEINLTPNEYMILVTMMQCPNKAFSRNELITYAFGTEFEGLERTVDCHIKNMRHKVEDDPKNPRYVKTVHGVGYKFGSE
jgi:Response regulators consisting of a CheY-like receiver domain and a winged-helix DNA-binding domain